MTTKIFEGKKITIRKLEAKDIKRAKEFQKYINSLIQEEAKLSANKKFSLKEEIKFLKEAFGKVKKRKKVFLIAECKNKIIGSTEIKLREGRLAHIGEFGISIAKEYRGIGLGRYLMTEIIKLAKKKLKPKPKIIRLTVFKNNKPAIALYKKMGFKKVAEIPKQLYWKGKYISEVIMLKFI